MKKQIFLFVMVFSFVVNGFTPFGLAQEPVAQQPVQKNLNPGIVIDLAGRSVKIPDQVNKIVTTFKPATLCILSLGLAEKLVGIDTSSRRDRLGLAVYPKIRDVKGVGSKSMGINFETLVSLKPDLVILYAQKDGLKLADRLDFLGIPSIVIIPETFETIKQSLALIVRAMGRDDRSIAVIKHMNAIKELVRNRMKNLPEEKRKKGYFASSRGVFSTATGNMLQHEIFTLAGVDNVSKDLRGYFQDISPEQLVEWNPDIMVLSRHMAVAETDKLKNKALSRITAIKHHQVYRCPSDMAPWDFPSPLSVLASLWLAKKAYPKRFSDIDLKEKVNEYHKALFNMTMDQMGGNLNDQL